MPKLNHSGPEGQGPRSGRKLGQCKSDKDESQSGKIGQGMGKRRKEGSGEGKGKRLRSNLP